MHRWSLGCGLLGIILGSLGYPWLFMGLGVALLAVGLAVVSYRARPITASARLWSAYALGLGGVAVALAGSRVVLTLIALEKVSEVAR